MRKNAIGIGLILLLLIFTSLPILAYYYENNNILANDYEDLPTVDSYSNLKSIVKEASNEKQFMYLGGSDVMQMETITSSVKTKAAGASDSNYSSTNVQVNGVDEADIVKTDGEYIYQVSNSKIFITKAYPANEMEIIKTIETEKDFYPQELYIDEKYLVVIGSSYSEVNYTNPEDGAKIYPYYYHLSTVKLIIYDIEDKSNINNIREVELEGQYVSSRKIGKSVYLVSNKYLDVYHILNEKTEIPAPIYRDSALGGESISIGYDQIRYFPNSPDSNYLLVAGLNLDKPDKEVNVSTYLGASDNIYASEDNLYITVTNYNNKNDTAITKEVPNVLERNSIVFKFKLDNGEVKYLNKGEVPGSILNQFSMDEYKGYFRIATTTGEMWRNDEYTSKNNIYILDKNLKEVGKIEDIAPGERIYSTRFMGDRAYMVTFRTVDPLFVIDLKQPESPKILGKLKIPGYSDYLHPYDENHIIGFGKDTIELKNEYKPSESMAYYQGMKIALFDVSDVNNPKEKFVEKIGDRGTDSELLRNHKALLFSKEKNLLAFPVTVNEVNNNNNNPLQYGEFVFQGAYVYNLDLESGFTLQNKITHFSDEDYIKMGDFSYDYNSGINRIIYIEDTLYTISNKMIKAHSMEDYKEINSIKLPYSN